RALTMANSKLLFYHSMGPRLSVLDVNVETGALTGRSSVELPANVQYAWPHPSKHTLYVVSSDGAAGSGARAGSVHRASALRIDPRFGDLTPRGEGLSLVSRPIHASVDRYGEYLLIAYNNPSNLTVHRIEADGRLGAEVNQAEKPDAGIYAHQI